MYWYGPSSGWAPRFCIGEVTVCGMYLAQNPLMGLVGVGDKVGAWLDADRQLSQRARALYEMTPKNGPLRWIEGQLATRGDLDAFLSLVDGKLRALALEGVFAVGWAAAAAPAPQGSGAEKGARQTRPQPTKVPKPLVKPLQVGPPKRFSARVLTAAGRG